MNLNNETENRIIGAAEKLFHQKGKAGTSMQEIADEAGINRTLLNYYFRSKDLLFEAVFRRALGLIIPRLASRLNTEISFSEYVPVMVGLIVDIMIENPQIPIFVLQELSSNPERMPRIIQELGIDQELAVKKIREEKAFNRFPDLDPRQIIMNILSMCIFPFAAKPVITELFYMGNEDAFIAAMQERKVVLPEMIISMLNNNDPS
jgi:AcrR family transcriptional regulator